MERMAHNRIPADEQNTEEDKAIEKVFDDLEARKVKATFRMKSRKNSAELISEDHDR
jgi:hypothetical protein